MTIQKFILMLRFNFKFILPKLDYKFSNLSPNLKRVSILLISNNKFEKYYSKDNKILKNFHQKVGYQVLFNNKILKHRNILIYKFVHHNNY